MFKNKKTFRGDKNEKLSFDRGINLYLDIATELRKWQKISFATFSLLFLTVVGYFILSMSIKKVPYIVEINSNGERIKVVGLEKFKYKANDKVIFSFLSNFIKNIRGITLDFVLNNNRLKEQYFFLTKITAQKLTEMIVNYNLSDMYREKESRDVEITSIVKIGSSNYQVRWQEKTYKQGKEIKFEKYVGIFTIGEINVSENGILINPLGIAITDFSISKELTEED